MKLLAGIDGGGTRTRLALVREEGILLGVGEGGCCSFTELGFRGARRPLASLWKAGWKHAGQPPRPADALFIGSGSILSEADAQTNCDLALALGLARSGCVRAGNDALNALEGGLLGRPGILLISGTGSACYGRNARGDSWRAGGWGHLLQDVGSAHGLGRTAMIAATRDADHRGESTSLTALVQAALGLRDLREIYRKVHHEGVSRAAVAALAPQVVEQAVAGDAVAKRILREAADGLVEMVCTVSRQLRLSRPKIALTGGLITNAALFRQMVLTRLRRRLPGCRIAEDGLAPVFGAVLLAREQLTGLPVKAEFIRRLRDGASRIALSP